MDKENFPLLVSTGTPGIGKTRSLKEIRQIIKEAAEKDPRLGLTNHKIIPLMTSFGNGTPFSPVDEKLGGAGSIFTRIFYHYYLERRGVRFSTFQASLRTGEKYFLVELLSRIAQDEGEEVLFLLQMDEIQTCLDASE